MTLAIGDALAMALLERWGMLATEAEEDFNTIFGAAFLRAYQQYIDQLDGPDAKP